jgi:hypothetical protein
MAINKGHVEAMYNLGLYYDEITNDYDNAIKYYKMASNKGHVEAMYNLELLFINNINLYIDTLLNNNYKPNNIKNNLIINKEYECPICYEDVIYSIKSICGHLYCLNCFSKLNKCAICRKKLI